MSAPGEQRYVGNELELFAQAKNWKGYWSSIVGAYIRGDVLEVGAGIGANTSLLLDKVKNVRRWVCLEPDLLLLDQLRKSLAGSDNLEPRRGTLEALPADEKFDAILYIDVLEHIQDDVAEVRCAAGHLRPGGHLIVLSPAHAWLFSPFDRAIGHCRRYTRGSLCRTAEGLNQLRLERCEYLDSCGLFASAANRLLLRQALPTLKQILFWDRLLVPMSRVIDPLLSRRVGKTVIAAWERVV